MRKDHSWTRPVLTSVILDTREHGPCTLSRNVSMHLYKVWVLLHSSVGRYYSVTGSAYVTCRTGPTNVISEPAVQAIPSTISRTSLRNHKKQPDWLLWTSSPLSPLAADWKIWTGRSWRHTWVQPRCSRTRCDGSEWNAAEPALYCEIN